MWSAFSVIVSSPWALRQADESSPPEMNPGQAMPDQTRSGYCKRQAKETLAVGIQRELLE